MSMHKTTLAPGQLCVLLTLRKVTSARRVTWCCTTGKPPRKVAVGQRKTYVNSYSHQTVHRGKVDPGVSELLCPGIMRTGGPKVSLSAHSESGVHFIKG